MRLAHLTDLHLPISARPQARELLNKRVLGYLSWRRNRQFRHRKEALEAVVEDCRRARPDFTAISGDLVNLSLPTEFSVAAQWLEGKFDPATAAFCPGNHDAYVGMTWREGAGRLDRFMSGERAGKDRPPSGADDFPFVRIAGEAALIFANSSPPTAPGLATGRLGTDQMVRIGDALDRLKEAGLARVLILHHPATEGVTPRRKALDDAGALRALIAARGVDLVLHGHTHFPVWAEIATPEGLRPVVGGGSASHPCANGKYRPARYNLFKIARAGVGKFTIDVDVRELDPALGAVISVERRRLLEGES
jgi:3',5'-cyclic AMP phosphodiesterase CpdA